MNQGSVIQGAFPHGIAHLTWAQRAPAQVPSVQPMSARPAWVQQAILRRSAPAPLQPRAIAPPPPQPRPSATGMSAPLPLQLAHIPSQGGQPLPRGVRSRMESFFGTSFADVRIHVDRHAAAIGALAFTHGPNIHFAPGQYDPATARGRQMLAHELAHVVQQRAGRVRNPFGGGIAVVHDARLEGEADRMAARAGVMPIQRLKDAQGKTVTLEQINAENDVAVLKDWKGRVEWDDDNEDKAIDARIDALNKEVLKKSLEEAKKKAAEEEAAQEKKDAGSPDNFDLDVSLRLKHLGVSKFDRKKFFIAAKTINNKTPAQLLAAIDEAKNDTDRAAAFSAFANGATVDVAKAISGEYSQLMTLDKDTKNVTQTLVTAMNAGTVLAKSVLYRDPKNNSKQLGNGEVFTFHIAGSEQPLQPEWHVHWGASQTPQAAGYKNYGNKGEKTETIQSDHNLLKGCNHFKSVIKG